MFLPLLEGDRFKGFEPVKLNEGIMPLILKNPESLGKLLKMYSAFRALRSCSAATNLSRVGPGGGSTRNPHPVLVYSLDAKADRF